MSQRLPTERDIYESPIVVTLVRTWRGRPVPPCGPITFYIALFLAVVTNVILFPWSIPWLWKWLRVGLLTRTQESYMVKTRGVPFWYFEDDEKASRG